MKHFVLVLLLFLSSFSFAEKYTHEEFSKHVVELLFSNEHKDPGDEYFFSFLRAKGIEPVGGFQKGKELDIEESVQLLGKLIGDKNKDNFTGANRDQYINRVSILQKTGDVFIQYSGKGKWRKAGNNVSFKESDLIKTGNNASAVLRIGTIGNVFLKENSLLDIVKMKILADGVNEDVHLHLDKGKMIVNVQDMSKNSNFQTSIPSTLVAVRGTIYELAAD